MNARPARREDVARSVVALSVGLVLAIVGFVFVWKQRAPGLVAMCPADASSSQLTLITGRFSQGSRGPGAWTLNAVAYDVGSGAKLGESPVTSKDRPYCAGGSRDTAWVVASGGDGPHLRRRSTGAVALSWEALVRGEPRLAVGAQTLGFDPATGSLTVVLRDARQLALAPDTGKASPFTGQVSNFALYGGFADGVLHTDAVPFHTSGNPRLVSADKRRLTFDGHPRAKVSLDGRPLFSGKDFYLPAFLIEPKSGTVEWPGGDFLIVEETLIGSLTYRVSRVDRSGKVRFTFTPDAPLPAAWKYRPTPWQPMEGGKTLVHLGERELVVIDAANGQERRRVRY